MKSTEIIRHNKQIDITRDFILELKTDTADEFDDCFNSHLKAINYNYLENVEQATFDRLVFNQQ